jgi:hypothetical protein
MSLEHSQRDEGMEIHTSMLAASGRNNPLADAKCNDLQRTGETDTLPNHKVRMSELRFRL